MPNNYRVQCLFFSRSVFEITWGRGEWHRLLPTCQSSLLFTFKQSSVNHGIKYTWKPTFIKRTSPLTRPNICNKRASARLNF